jgi:AcrR family transcriptional regulator
MNIHLSLSGMRARDENKIEAIREKAIEMIVNEGFDGLSMQKLAKAANVSPATIYIYYKNREDLLNQLYNEVQRIFTDETLKGFDPEGDFESGLWTQWQNRFRYIKKYPLHFQFLEQFRNSPLVNHNAVMMSGFKEQMKKFVRNAVKRGDIPRMEPEIFWSVSYGSFYALIKFHLAQKSMMNKNFTLTETILKQTFRMVLTALQSK